jgi:site-specific DNA recombinase
MTHTFTGNGSKRYRYYTCTQVIKKGRRACPSRSLPAAEIESAVVDQIRCIAGDAGLREQVLRQAQADVDAELATLRADLAALEREVVRHHAEIRKLAVSGEQTAAAAALMANLQDCVVQSEPRVIELRDQIVAVEAEKLDQGAVDAAFADFDNVWNALSPREQSQILALLVARVEFDASDSTIAVEFHPSAIKSLANGGLGAAA